MRWLARYNQRHYAQILQLIDEYEQGTLGVGAFVGDLDVMLNVWAQVTDEWDDPFLTKWTELERIAQQARVHGDQKLVEQDRQLVAEVATELKQRIRFIFEQRQYQRMLIAIVEYEQGTIPLNTLQTELVGLLLGLADDLMGAYRPFWAEVWDLEDAVDSADYWTANNLEQQYQARITATLNSLKQLIQPLLAKAIEGGNAQ